jgi:hypothetical protein
MKHLITLYYSILFLYSYWQWSINPAVNTPVCTALNKQVDPRIIEDGKGGAIIAWKDYRNPMPDVYVQRIDKNGMVKWAIDGVGACTDAADQSTPNICEDGEGGCIISWSDWRSGIERDIYAQRLDSNGNVLWISNGVVVTNKPNREHNEKIVSDGLGGAIIVWEEQDANGNWDEWGQRINASGTTLWAPGGVPLSTTYSNKINGRLEADGLGGAFIVWQDFRNGVDYDIYGQHLDASGNKVWGSAAKLICNAPGTQASPKIEPDGLGGFYTAWIDARQTDNDIYAQHVDLNGNLTWPNNGVPVCITIGNQSALDILSDPTVDGLICSWKDNRNGDYDIYAQRISPAGLMQWNTNGLAVCTNNYDQLNPNIAIDNTGGAIITWQDSLTLNFDIRAQRVNAGGTPLWTNAGVNVAIAVGDQTSVKNCTDGATGSIFVFMDKRSGVNDIFVHHIYGTGFSYSLAALESETSPALEVYPNPTQSIINIQSSTSIDKIVWQSLDGKLMAAFPQHQSSIDVTHYPRGSYLLHIYQGETHLIKHIILQ